MKTGRDIKKMVLLQGRRKAEKKNEGRVCIKKKAERESGFN